jgi:nucleoside-diphosphate-sugar epimerase
MRENLPIVTLRLFSPYGPFEEGKRLVSSVISSCINRKPVNLSSPKPVRDFVYIKDVLHAYENAYKYREVTGGGVFNIGGGVQYTVGEVVERIIALTGTDSVPVWNSVSNMRIEPLRWQADISRTKSILHWEPRYNLEEGLKETISWFKENSAHYE